MLVVNPTIPSLPDPSREIHKLWGCWEEPNADGGLHGRNGTPIDDNNIPAEMVKMAMKLHNPTLFCIIYHGQQADATSRTKPSVYCSHSYLLLDNIHQPPAKKIMNDSREGTDDDCERWLPNPPRFQIPKPDFHQFESQLQTMIIKLEWDIGVNQNHAVRLSAQYEKRVVAEQDVGWLCEHNYNLDPPTAGSLANRQCTTGWASSN